uniref:Acetylglutamate kinase n=1 Tax=Anotrichium furcellatum TaxID=41999 RepID=A0A4D6WKA0_9FLOR|nr:acetylglutamate kinase [Anotrichium furcellatum]
MIVDSFDRIEFLHSILPFIKKYSGSVFVIKYGGAAMRNLSDVSLVVEDILFLYYLGIKPVVIHGGGPFINDWLIKVNIEPKFHEGLRITDSATMEIVQMVLSGKVNKQLVSVFNKNSKKNLAVGLSGHDACLVQAEPLFNLPDNFIGRVTGVNTEIIQLLFDSNYIPIIASTGVDNLGQSYNINADTVAGVIAGSLKAQKLFLLTDSPGIMYDINDHSSVIKNLNFQIIEDLKAKNIINGGMIPKSNACLEALNHGVDSAHIIDGRLKHSLLYEVFTEDRLGSMITL